MLTQRDVHLLLRVAVFEQRKAADVLDVAVEFKYPFGDLLTRRTPNPLHGGFQGALTGESRRKLGGMFNNAYREVVRTLRDSLAVEDIAAARPLLRDLIGPITTIPTESDGERCLTAHFPAFSAEARLVAGAGFEPATFGL